MIGELITHRRPVLILQFPTHKCKTRTFSDKILLQSPKTDSENVAALLTCTAHVFVLLWW